MPVINENDTVATSEIRFGDNDRLAARVAEMVEADQLVLLSDIDGLYTADPKRDPAAAHIPVVAAAHAGDRGDGRGAATGLFERRDADQAGRRADRDAGGLRHGDRVGHVHRPLQALADGARCTWFLPLPKAGSARKRWIAGSLQPAGRLIVDAGAARALAAGRSLLPAGVREIEGEFERGDPVLVQSRDGTVSAAAYPPMAAPTPAASRATAPRRSKPSSAGAAATRSCTGTT